MLRKLLVLVMMTSSTTVWSQKRIIDPVITDYASILKFDRIEFTKTQTIADVTVRFTPNMWVRYDSLTVALKDCNSDRKYRLLRSEGFELNKQVTLPASGEIKARFYYEPIDAEVEVVDGVDDMSSPIFGTFGIHLKRPALTLPEWMAGSWLENDGSNTLECAFGRAVALYRNAVWDYASVTPRGKGAATVVLQNNESGTATLYVKAGKENSTLALSTDNQHFKTLSHELVERADPNGEKWTFDPEKYRDELYHPGTAVIRGVLEGYSPRLGFNTIRINQEDFLTGEDTPITWDIAPDGRFEGSVSLDAPSCINLEMNKKWVTLHIAPNDTLTCLLPVEQLFGPKTFHARDDSNLLGNRFMGSNAMICTGISQLKHQMPNAALFYDRIQTMYQPDSVKTAAALIEARNTQRKNSLTNYFDRHTLDTRSRDMLYTEFMSVKLTEQLDFISFYDWNKTLTRRDSTGGYYSVANPDYRPMPRWMYESLDQQMLDNPLIVTTSEFWVILNRAKFSKQMRNEALNAMLQGSVDPKLLQQAQQQAIEQLATTRPLTDNEREALNIYGNCKVYDSSQRRADSIRVAQLIGNDTTLLRQYREQIAPLSAAIFQKVDRLRDSVKRHYETILYDSLRSYRLDRSVVYDYARAQHLYDDMETSFIAPEDNTSIQRLSQMLPYIKTPFIVQRLIAYYVSKVADQPIAPTPTTRDAVADAIFDSIIAPYKGNVLMLDFWGMSCGPCKVGMLDARKTVDELKDHKIKFLYITSVDWSPKELTDDFLRKNKIQGEQIRLSNDAMNRMMSKFRFNGIPHVEYVDKQGNLVTESSNTHSLDRALLLRLEAAE